MHAHGDDSSIHDAACVTYMLPRGVRSRLIETHRSSSPALHVRCVPQRDAGGTCSIEPGVYREAVAVGPTAGGVMVELEGTGDGVVLSGLDRLLE